jgi:hypothetical protein
MKNRKPMTEVLDAQGRMEPGDEGWWKVWGASMQDVRQGDLIMAGLRKDDGTKEVVEHFVREVVYEGGIKDAIWLNFIDLHGEKRGIGMLCPVAIVRRGTHNILSPSAR